MFTITVTTNFWASHQVTLPDGSTEPPHSHNWSVSADVSSVKLDDNGMVMDFCLLKQLLDGITSPLTNQPIDQADYFRKNGQSTEIIAKYIFEKLQPQLPTGVTLEQIQLTEHPGCAVKYEP
ncbi:MAG: 6-carboxytetrahydropterin synthase [Phycisphaerales bacterium]